MNDNVTLIGSNTAGGLFGIADSPFISKCSGVFGNSLNIQGTTYAGGLAGSVINLGALSFFRQSNGIFGNDCIIQGDTVGGMIGNKPNSSYNCNIIFGQNCIIQGITRAGGIAGFGQYSIALSNLTDCSVTFVDYKITGTTANAITIGNTTRTYALTFGSPTSGSNVTNVPNASVNLQNVKNTYNSNLNSQWLTPLLNLRQKLNTDGTAASPTEIPINNTSYLNDMVGENPLSPDVSVTLKNAAIQLSLGYANIDSISTDFNSIKSLLTSYGTKADQLGATPIIYLNSVSPYELGTLVPGTKSLTFTPPGVIYTPLNNGVISIDAYVSTSFVTVASTTPGILFDDVFTPIDESHTKSSLNFTPLGVGSGLIEITDYVPPPPVPTEASEGLEWYWWVLIVLGSIILIAFLLYYFIYPIIVNLKFRVKEL